MEMKSDEEDEPSPGPQGCYRNKQLDTDDQHVQHLKCVSHIFLATALEEGVLVALHIVELGSDRSSDLPQAT